MIIHSASFVKSSPTLKECPAPLKPEFGFIGRSNVGKSSLINMLTGRKKLAKTSVQPGKTRTINHFLINDLWYLVDLPGYGYAKVPVKLREKWVRATKEYILKRETLVSLFVLIDSRHKPQRSDIDFSCLDLTRSLLPESLQKVINFQLPPLKNRLLCIMMRCLINGNHYLFHSFHQP
jgi:GTP-binding protein